MDKSSRIVMGAVEVKSRYVSAEHLYGDQKTALVFGIKRPTRAIGLRQLSLPFSCILAAVVVCSVKFFAAPAYPTFTSELDSRCIIIVESQSYLVPKACVC